MKRLLLILVLFAGMAATTGASDLSRWLRERNHRDHYRQRDHYRLRPRVRKYRPYPMTHWEIHEMMERDAARRRYEQRYYYRAPFTFHFDF